MTKKLIRWGIDLLLVRHVLRLVAYLRSSRAARVKGANAETTEETPASSKRQARRAKFWQRIGPNLLIGITIEVALFAGHEIQLPVLIGAEDLAMDFVMRQFRNVKLGDEDTAFVLPPSGRLTAGVFSTPYYEVWGWELTEGSVWAKIHEYVANHYIFNNLITGQWEIFRDAVKHMILPAVALATIPLSIIARITRSSLLEVMGKDYIRTARAKGVKERTVVRSHAFRNALLPVVTIIGLQLGALMGGAVLTETVFNLGGVGRALFDAITGRDYAIVQGFTVVIAAGYVIVNLLVDLSYAYLDPRIRLE